MTSSENVLPATPAADAHELAFQAASGADHELGLRVTAGAEPVIEVIDNGAIVVSEPLAQIDHVKVSGAAGNDTLLIESSVPPSIAVHFDGQGGNDTLHGPVTDATWDITRHGSGQVGQVEFEAIENLAGAVGNRDTFVMGAQGGIDRLIDGGRNGFDSIVLEQRSVASSSYNATGPDSGTIQRDADLVRYAGMEPIIDNGDSANRVFTATAGADQIVLKAGSSAGHLAIESSSGTFESIEFPNPSDSLTILGGLENDSITVQSLDPAFSGSLTVVGDLLAQFTGIGGDDHVTFGANVTAPGKNISVYAKSISVDPGKVLSTVKAGGGSGNITFEAQDITLNNGAQLLAGDGDVLLDVRSLSFIPLTVVPPAAASITLHSATVHGDAIQFKAYSFNPLNQLGFSKEAFKKSATSTILVDSSDIDGSSVLMDANGDTTLIPNVLDTATMQGNPALTFTHHTGGGPSPVTSDTIERSTGSWLDDKFLPGQSISITGSQNNDGDYIVALVTPTMLTLHPAETLANETTDPSTTPVTIIGTSVLPDPETVVTAFFSIDSVVVSRSTATGKVQVTGSSVIHASNDVLISAEGHSLATPIFPGLAIPKVLAIAAVWAESHAVAEASISGTSQITAVGQFNLTRRRTTRSRPP